MTQPNAAGQYATSLALNANWTDDRITPTVTNVGNSDTLATCGSGYSLNNYWYPYYQPLYTYERRPIRLTMAEVERLRVAAKKDKALRVTLEKFTDHIEVVVNFGETK